MMQFIPKGLLQVQEQWLSRSHWHKLRSTRIEDLRNQVRQPIKDLLEFFNRNNYIIFRLRIRFGRILYEPLGLNCKFPFKFIHKTFNLYKVHSFLPNPLQIINSGLKVVRAFNKL